MLNMKKVLLVVATLSVNSVAFGLDANGATLAPASAIPGVAKSNALSTYAKDVAGIVVKAVKSKYAPYAGVYALGAAAGELPGAREVVKNVNEKVADVLGIDKKAFFAHAAVALALRAAGYIPETKNGKVQYVVTNLKNIAQGLQHVNTAALVAGSSHVANVAAKVSGVVPAWFAHLGTTYLVVRTAEFAKARIIKALC